MPYATGSGIRIHYETEGSGPPLVLHAGFQGTIVDWYEAGYVDALKADSTLVLLDPRGQGDSDKPHEPAAYSPAQRVADVLAVLDALGVEQTDFLGYSMGGYAGFDLAAQAPERLQSLLIGGSQPFGYTWSRSLPGITEQFRQGMPAVIAGYERMLGPLEPTRRERWLAQDAEALAAMTLADWPGVEAALPTMYLLILLYCGENDPAHGPARRAAALLPNATFVSLPALNHREVMFTSAALPHVTAFLKRVRTGTGASTASA